jgi:lysozyme family protein
MSFEAAYGQTKKFEGGYVWDKADAGGETYRGITRRIHPAWPGWARVDEAKTRFGYQPKKIDEFLKGDPQLDAQVELLYRKNYWEPLGELPDLVKAKAFDISVNMGQAQAVKILQRALADMGERLAVDGAIGPVTRAAAEGKDQAAVVAGMCLWQARRYRELVKARPANQKFLKGWLNRASWNPAI